MEEKKFTLRDLKRTLETLSEEQLERIVWTAGCDCYGSWNGILTEIEYDGKPSMLLERNE